MKTVAIAGATGLIGSALKRAFEDAGHPTYGIDTRVGYGTADIVIHAAGYGQPTKFLADEQETIRCNVSYTSALLNMLSPGGTFLFLSTSELYSGSERIPHTEDDIGTTTPNHPRACYDLQTEVLTDNGWRLFKDIGNSKVATLNLQGTIEYHIPEAFIEYDYVGHMLRFANDKYDLCVTPDHQMYVSGASGIWRFIGAGGSRYWREYRIPTGAIFSGEELEYIDLGSPLRNAKRHFQGCHADDWLEFFGYFISEGCVYKRKRISVVNGKSYDAPVYNVIIAQQKLSGRAKMEACFKRMNLPYTPSAGIQYVFPTKQLYELFLPYGKAGDKYIPREYLSLSPRQSRILLDALMLGDGSWKGKDQGCYFTKSERLADDVQELAMRCGLAASKRARPGREMFNVNIRPSKVARLRQPEKQPYAGKVYCVSVPNHVICVRRNGTASWCGNCYIESKRCGEALVYAARRKGIDAKIARCCLIYGPGTRADDSRILNVMMRDAITKGEVRLRDNGMAMRPYLYIDDAVQMLMAIVRAGTQPVYNVGLQSTETLRDAATLIGHIEDVPVHFGEGPPLPGSPLNVCVSIARYEQEFGHIELIPLEEGLRRTLAWQREHLYNEPWLLSQENGAIVELMDRATRLEPLEMEEPPEQPGWRRARGLR